MPQLAQGIRITLFLTVFAAQVLGQSQTGFPPFGSMAGSQWDAVNLANLNVHLAIPVTARQGRGLNYRFTMAFDSTVYSNTGGAWLLNFGWTGIGGGSTGNLVAIQSALVGTLLPGSVQLINCTGGGTGTATTTSAYMDPFQTVHPFIMSIATNTCNGGSGGGSTTTGDGSGYLVTISSTGIGTVTDIDGTVRVVPPVASSSSPANLTDRNGNQIIFDGTTLTDTLGTSPLSLLEAFPATSPTNSPMLRAERQL